MRKLTVFNHETLDGCFVDQNGDMSWAHQNDPEWNAFVAENAGSGGELLFGRITYQMMAGFWPTPQALAAMPAVAEGMNSARKVVFSRTLAAAPWNNTQLIKGDLAAAVRKLKQQPGEDMVILGSGTIVSQLAQEGLVDQFQIIVHPIVLGKGRSMFDGVTRKLALKRTASRSFTNGNTLLSYEPVS